MWISTKEWREFLEEKEQLKRRIESLELVHRPTIIVRGQTITDDSEFVIDHGTFHVGWPYGLSPIGRKTTTVDKVLRLILAHLKLKVEWKDASEGSAFLRASKS